MTTYATCGDCMKCHCKVSGDDPFWVDEAKEHDRLLEAYGICECEGEYAILVPLARSVLDPNCPCAGDSWEPR